MLLRLALLAAIISNFAFAADVPKPKKIPGDKKAIEMDYGPALAVTVGVTKENIAFKGILISLNKERTVNVLFDTELLRVTAAWTGGYLNWASRVYADNNNDYCTANGDIQFATSPLPGWTKNAERADPRKPKDGPLPSDWAKYKGLYLNGDTVVLSYTVGGVEVLEAFETATPFDKRDFTRVLQIAPAKQPMELFAFEGVHDPKYDPPEWTPDPSHIHFSAKDGATRGDLVKPPAELAWSMEPGKDPSQPARAYLKIAPHEAPLFFKVRIWKDDLKSKDGSFLSGREKKLTNLTELTHGGPARWTQIPETKGALAAAEDAPYVIDTLTAPDDNPYKSWLRFTGLDFFPDGRAALCTWNGDVWIVSGIDAKLEALKWKRFATGLNNPMGIKVIDGAIHTIGRDQITKLHDLNNDGEADFYENINNDCMLTTNFHEMCFDLQTDKDGNFYFTKGSSIWAGEQRPTAHSGTFIKVSKDGSKFEVLCNGLRAPNGIGVGPEGELTCSDNQGNWIPACPINLVKKDAYFGWVGHGQKAENFKTPDKPLCWIPYSFDHSTSGQIWADKTNTKWGPLAGRMLVASYDCSLLTVFFDRIDGEAQGGVVKFPLKFASGMMRPRFSPIDGQLYMAGLKGWSSSAARDCQFARVRYTGKPVCMPLEARLTKSGFEVLFSEKLDRESATDKQNVAAEWFNIVRTSNYGSPDYSVTDPAKKSREPLEIAGLKLNDDGKTLVVGIANLKPVTNLILKFKLKAADGTPVKYDLSYTINRMP